jgi:hypothetical protein
MPVHCVMKAMGAYYEVVQFLNSKFSASALSKWDKILTSVSEGRLGNTSRWKH